MLRYILGEGLLWRTVFLMLLSWRYLFHPLAGLSKVSGAQKIKSLILLSWMLSFSIEFLYSAIVGVQREEMEAKTQKMATDIIDMAVDNTLDFCVDRILAEEDGDQMNGSLVDVGSDEEDGLLDDGLSPKGADMGGEILASPTADLLMAGGKGSMDGRNSRAQARSSSSVGTGRVAVSAPPRIRADHQLLRSGSALAEHILVAARVKEAAVSPTRASPRLAGVIDQHAMEKAKKRTAWKNLDTEGNLQGHTLDTHLVAAV